MTDEGKTADPSPNKIHYLTAAENLAIRRELQEDYKFTFAQTAQLAGLSVATAVSRIYTPIAFKDVLIICGSQTIGTYGLAAGIHLIQFGYNVSVYHAKHTQQQFYLDFLALCEGLGAHMIKVLPPTDKLKLHYKVIVDALYDNEDQRTLEKMLNADVPLCSIDVPSGWDLETGPKSEDCLKPSMLISIGAPKMCAHPDILPDIHHFLGGRFISPAMKEKYHLVLPNYPGDEQIVDMNCFGPCCRKKKNNVNT